MPWLRSNKELLAGFRAGHRESLEAVYRAYHSTVRARVRLLARHTAFASVLSTEADLVQDVFIRAFSERARLAYDATRDYAPYLNTIARNRAMDALRKSQREHALVEGWERLSDHHAEPFSGHDVAIAAALQDYLENLPTTVSGVYRQRFVAGLSQQRCCAVLNMSRRSLRTCEARLARGLRRHLQSKGLLAAASDRF